MFGLFSEHTSCSGDTHEFIIAAFTTKDKAEDIRAKFKDYFPKETFRVLEYNLPKIDPTFEDLLWETSNETASHEAETLLQDNEQLPKCGGDSDGLGRLLEL